MSVTWEVIGLAVFAGILIVVAIHVLLDYRTTPEKRERIRRQAINRRGRLADGTITEASPSTLYYSYLISGVLYTTSQDISQLSDFLPAEPERLVGPVWLKYSTQNPANSIVVCEQWSGLPVTSKKEQEA